VCVCVSVYLGEGLDEHDVMALLHEVTHGRRILLGICVCVCMCAGKKKNRASVLKKGQHTTLKCVCTHSNAHIPPEATAHARTHARTHTYRPRQSLGMPSRT